MRVKCHLHLPRMKANNPECISVKPAGPTYYTDRITLSNVKFVVQPAGRRRTLSENQRTVHAFVCGDVVNDVDVTDIDDEAYYNPFKVETFVRKSNFSPILTAKYAVMTGHKVHIVTT